jgi:hypothetical protein
MSAPSSAALACERTAHPLLLHCLQDFNHDWRRLALVNRAMAAAFREYASEVARHERLRRARAALFALPRPVYPHLAHDCWGPRCILDIDLLPRLIAEFEAMPWPPLLHTSE